MKSFGLALFASVFALPTAGLAQNDEVIRGHVPEWVVESEPMAVPDDATGPVYIRKQDMLVHLDDEGQSSFNGQMFRILNSQALQAGNISIVWNPAAGAPTIHRLLVHRDAEVIDVLDETDFEILRREDQLEQSMLDGMLTAVLRVPDLRVGDDLELAYTVPSNDPILGSTNFGILFLADSPPPGRIRLGLGWEPGQKPEIRLSDGLADMAVSEGQSIDIYADNVGILTGPKDAPPRYNWQRVAEYSDFQDWQAVSRRFAPLFAEASEISPKSKIAIEAVRIAAANDGELARAQAALELVQQQVRYIYVGLNGGNFAPASAEETWSRRYGDCKGKTVLLLSLLDALGIEAEAVLVNNSGLDDGYDERLPNPGLFDHVLVRATIDGAQYWMDGTLPHVAGVSAEPAFRYRWALPLSVQGSALEALPRQPFSLAQDMGIYEIDAREGFDQPARLTYTMVQRGPKALAEYMQFSAISANQIETNLRNALTGDSQWNEIEKVDYRFDSDTGASILTITGTGPLDWEDEGGGAYDLVLPGGGFNPPGRRKRASDQDQDAPFYTAPAYSCYATTVRLPEGTDTENWGFNTVFDTMMYGQLYYRMMERRDDGTIRMVRGARVEREEISPDKARRDNKRLTEFDNSMARISYDPDRTMTPYGELRGVPATYEIDWTGADAPCLPADVLDEK